MGKFGNCLQGQWETGLLSGLEIYDQVWILANYYAKYSRGLWAQRDWMLTEGSHVVEAQNPVLEGTSCTEPFTFTFVLKDMCLRQVPLAYCSQFLGPPTLVRLGLPPELRVKILRTLLQQSTFMRPSWRGEEQELFLPIQGWEGWVCDIFRPTHCVSTRTSWLPPCWVLPHSLGRNATAVSTCMLSETAADMSHSASPRAANISTGAKQKKVRSEGQPCICVEPRLKAAHSQRTFANAKSSPILILGWEKQTSLKQVGRVSFGEVSKRKK